MKKKSCVCSLFSLLCTIFLSLLCVCYFSKKTNETISFFFSSCKTARFKFKKITQNIIHFLLFFQLKTWRTFSCSNSLFVCVVSFIIRTVKRKRQEKETETQQKEKKIEFWIIFTQDRSRATQCFFFPSSSFVRSFYLKH